MRIYRSVLALLFVTAAVGSINAQTRKAAAPEKKPSTAARAPEIGQSAVVVDELLSNLRKEPSLFAESVHRMQRGRRVQILGVAAADGVKFFKVTAPPRNFGWVQAEAVFGKFRAGDEDRLVRLMHATDGFEQLEIAVQFFQIYPDSKLKPAVLLLFGDKIEEAAARLSRDATSRISRQEMVASAAPMHSYFLNFNMLDRYRRLGIVFLFNPFTRLYHYNGASWKQIVEKYPGTNEAAEAQKRIDSLKLKMEKK